MGISVVLGRDRRASRRVLGKGKFRAVNHGSRAAHMADYRSIRRSLRSGMVQKNVLGVLHLGGVRRTRRV
jgi:hypothetical protein